MSNIISINNLPHRVSLYKKISTISVDITKRSKLANYEWIESNVECFMEPVSLQDKTVVGIEYSKDVRHSWFQIKHKNKIGLDDLIIWEGNAYVVKDWIVYDIGPEIVQHIESVTEKLPSIPEGVVVL